MKIRIGCVVLGFSSLVLSLVLSMAAQTSGSAGSTAQLPRLVKFSGTLKDANGNALTGVAGVTFALYSEPGGGAPLWLETQNVQPDKNGHYTVLLGSTKREGLPLGLFVSEQARWLGVQAEGQAERARVLLVAVPYAMKAADAETVGGLPPSAFVRALPVSSGAGVANGATSSSASPAPEVTSNVTTTGGTVNALPLWTTATNIQSSTITQTGSGSTAKVGIGTTTPAVTLDVKGAENVGGTLTLPAMGTATSTQGYNSQPDLMIASVYNSGTATPVNQKFQLQAEPVNNDKTTASGTLNLLYGSGTASPAETGLKINNKGQITFAAGQTFPGAGTVTSVGLTAPSSDFTVSGSPVTKSGTLALKWNVVPTSADTANAIVKRDANGGFAAGGITATSSGVGVWGQSDGTGGGSDGVHGVTSSAGASGVAGVNNSGGIGVYATGGTGVYAQTGGGAGIGVFGQTFTESATGQSLGSASAGIWGDGGGSSAAVIGTADSAIAGLFISNYPSGYALIAENDGANGTIFWAIGVGVPQPQCYIDNSGNLSCTGTKNAVVPLDGGKRKVALSAIESPKNWFEDFGSAQLNGGSAVVALDPDFIQTVNTEREYMVIPVPNGECKGLYVANKTATSFEVRELGGGTSSIRFDYRIVALRRKYEDVRFADHTNDPDPRKVMKEMRAKGQPTIRAAAQPVAAQPK